MRKSNGVRVHHEKRSNGVRVDDEKNSDGREFTMKEKATG